MRQWGARHFESWRDERSDAEILAIQDYKDREIAARINGALRAGSRLSAEDQQRVARLDAALGEAPVPEPIVVFRVMARTAFSAWISDLRDDRFLLDRGFTSTSRDPRAARKAAQTAADVLIRIRVPAGAHGAYIDLGDPLLDLGEFELLLARGSRFTLPAEGRGIIEVELLR